MNIPRWIRRQMDDEADLISWITVTCLDLAACKMRYQTEPMSTDLAEAVQANEEAVRVVARLITNKSRGWLCGAFHPDKNWRCILPAEHGGDHSACLTSIEWPQKADSEARDG